MSTKKFCSFISCWLKKINQSGRKNKISRETLEYIPDTSAAILMRTPSGGKVLIYLSALSVILFFVWAYFAHIDVTVRGTGKVIPASRIQVVQNLEGGIISSIMVSEGEQVAKNQPLMKLDNTRFQASYKESEVEYKSLLITSQRIQAEINNQPLIFSDDPQQHDNIEREQALYKKRQETLANQLSIAREQANQIKQQLNELLSKQKYLEKNLAFAKKELELTHPLSKEGAISEVDILRLKQRVNELAGELEAAYLAAPRLKSAIQSAERKQQEITLEFQQKVINEQKVTQLRVAQLNEILSAHQDRVSRTLVRSPVEGTVKKIHFNTSGGVVQPGKELMEIVPYQDQLLIEAHIKPKDIAFLRPGLPAVVKISAYDYATHGGLNGVVEHISADTINNDSQPSQQSYYIVRVRTEKNNLGSDDKPVIPGMVTNVDVITNKRSVLASIFKPLLKAKEQALRER